MLKRLSAKREMPGAFLRDGPECLLLLYARVCVYSLSLCALLILCHSVPGDLSVGAEYLIHPAKHCGQDC